jgi:TonB family protein
MKRTLSWGCLSLWVAGACLGQTPEPLCPRHIEMPSYPPIARTVHVTGEVILTITIDSNGNVNDAKVTNDDKSVGLLEPSAIGNIRLWTFAKPPTAPYSQTIVYNYVFDQFLPGDDGTHPITNVILDLPDRVTILGNLRFVDHGPGNGAKLRPGRRGEYSDSLIAIPAAKNPRYVGFRDGRQQLTYTSESEFPARAVLFLISNELMRKGWKPLPEDFLNPNLPSSHIRGWAEFEDATQQPKVSVRAWLADWENAAHDITVYELQYRFGYPETGPPDLKTLRVLALYIPASVASEMKRAAASKH